MLNNEDILVCLYEKLFPHRTGIARSAFFGGTMEPGAQQSLKDWLDVWIVMEFMLGCELDFLGIGKKKVDGWELAMTIVLVMIKNVGHVMTSAEVANLPFLSSSWATRPRIPRLANETASPGPHLTASPQEPGS